MSFHPNITSHEKEKTSQDDEELSSTSCDLEPRSRKRTKVASNAKRPITRLPKTRTKSGCFTCRKRKKKCDEGFPVCSGCSRNFLECTWPSSCTETLPKHFEINSSTGAKLEIAPDSLQLDLDPVTAKEMESSMTTFKINSKNSMLQQINVDENAEMQEEYEIPASMCSIIQLPSYKHSKQDTEASSPLSSNAEPPSSNGFDFVVNLPNGRLPTNLQSPIMDPPSSVASLSPLEIPTKLSPHHSAIDSQSVNQMFSSLYDTLSTTKSPTASWEPTDDIPGLYRDFVEQFQDSQTFYEQSNKASSVRDIIYSYGSSFFSNSVRNTESHYSNNPNTKYAKTAFLNSLNSKYSDEDSFKLLSAAKCCLSLLHIPSSTTPKSVLSAFVTNYPLLIYFSSSLSSVPSPFELLKSKERMQLSSHLNSVDNTNTDEWLINSLRLTMYLNMAKLTYLLRTSSQFIRQPEQRMSLLNPVKSSMTITWTQLQTLEIRHFQSGTPSRDLKVLKIIHYSMEIMLLKLNDLSTSGESHVVQHYLDLLIEELSCSSVVSSPAATSSLSTGFKSLSAPPTRSRSNSPSRHSSGSVISSNENESGMLLMSLFVAGCVAKSLSCREFISKEVYLLSTTASEGKHCGDFDSRGLGFRLEDLWCLEENGGMNAFDAFVSRFGLDSVCF